MTYHVLELRLPLLDCPGYSCRGYRYPARRAGNIYLAETPTVVLDPAHRPPARIGNPRENPTILVLAARPGCRLCRLLGGSARGRSGCCGGCRAQRPFDRHRGECSLPVIVRGTVITFPIYRTHHHVIVSCGAVVTLRFSWGTSTTRAIIDRCELVRPTTALLLDLVQPPD